MFARFTLSWRWLQPSPLFIAAVLLAFGAAACHATPTAWPVTIEISHLAGNDPLALGTPIRTVAGEDVTIDELRYYVSNLRLRQANGGWFSNPQFPDRADGYFLVNDALAASKKLSIGPVPDGDYDGLEFMIGVDEGRNHAGAQTGALDPANGMFWTWHTGYIFLKMEGHSPQSTSDAHAVSYHVGGGNASANLSRTVYLPLPQAIHVQPALAAEIHLDADLSALFAGASPLRVADLPQAMQPPGTVQIADRFANAFRVDHVHNLPRRPGVPSK